jgi:hypothetical protein
MSCGSSCSSYCEIDGVREIRGDVDGTEALDEVSMGVYCMPSFEDISIKAPSLSQLRVVSTFARLIYARSLLNIDGVDPVSKLSDPPDVGPGVYGGVCGA